MYVFWTVGKGRNVIVSRDKALCLQKVKFLFFFFFVYFLWSETKNVFCGSFRDHCAFHPLGEL